MSITTKVQYLWFLCTIILALLCLFGNTHWRYPPSLSPFFTSHPRKVTLLWSLPPIPQGSNLLLLLFHFLLLGRRHPLLPMKPTVVPHRQQHPKETENPLTQYSDTLWLSYILLLYRSNEIDWHWYWTMYMKVVCISSLTGGHSPLGQMGGAAWRGIECVNGHCHFCCTFATKSDQWDHPPCWHFLFLH